MLREKFDALLESAGPFLTPDERRGLVVLYERAVAVTEKPSETTISKFQRSERQIGQVPFLTHEAVWGGFREGRRRAEANQPQ